MTHAERIYDIAAKHLTVQASSSGDEAQASTLLGTSFHTLSH
jgi:hypothetical protein